MRQDKISLRFAIGLMLILAATVIGQNKFSDENVEYEFVLPNNDWKMTVKPSEFSPNVEYVYKDRRSGHLQIRKLKVEKDDLFSDMIRGEEIKLQFVTGFVAGKRKNFSALFPGRVFDYEYVRSGRNMSGRLYFFRIDETTAYVVRFRGRKTTLSSIQNQTDSIARTFKIRQADEEKEKNDEKAGADDTDEI